jgi:hypothetical protein
MRVNMAKTTIEKAEIAVISIKDNGHCFNSPEFGIIKNEAENGNFSFSYAMGGASGDYLGKVYLLSNTI